MFTAISDSQLYEERIKKDLMYQITRLHPIGGVVDANDILSLDSLGSSPSDELVAQKVVPLFDKLKTRQEVYNASRQQLAQQKTQMSVDEQSNTKPIQVLF
ncbi:MULTISPECIES: hypothetical protein [Vibrio]|uniref:hypothetical protein n=1 Tax=Vibrio TaxID=662 RepID=UPI001E33C7CE|nr:MULTISPECIES: hypothetical protein [Vibrio]MCC2524958.1 hypothetical protein [Vibrio coralliilyticus]USD35503.1 hypothetical protein J8Z27_23065 [Vibrio sp. SCSIO 43186]USD72627.1 hypothetical protein J4N41_23070 [Vibrio sp. SCSIO 43139]USD99018.1 hypothetical protein CTT30_23380 [Vibrio coralliilyticus]